VGPLSTRVHDECRQLASWLPEPQARVVTQLQELLEQPLSVAVVGEVKAGKSTLVNALIGRRVAPTAATECTKVVTWYRRGPQKAVARLRDGTSRRVPFTGQLPDQLPVAPSQVQQLDVWLQERSLEGLTLVDTPGLFSTTQEREAATRDALFGQDASQHAVSKVDAVIFAFMHKTSGEQVRVLKEFRAATADSSAAALNAVGAMTQADKMGSGAVGERDPMKIAREYAIDIAQQQQALLADIVPVAGLLAETRKASRLQEAHVEALQRLQPLTKDHFLIPDTKPHRKFGVDDATWQVLVERLGTYGVLVAKEVASGGLQEVYDAILERSGIEELERLVHTRFRQRSDALKASRALGALRRQRFAPQLSPEHKQQLHRRVEALELDPLLHRIAELRASDQLARSCEIGDDDVRRLRDLLAGFGAGEPAAALLGLADSAGMGQLREAAHEGHAWAQRLRSQALLDRAVEDGASVLATSFSLLAQRCR
jgi:hypothetical protein